MGQVLHGSATTTHAIRAAIQRSKAPLKELAARYGLNRKTVAKWRKRSFLHDAPMGPKATVRRYHYDSHQQLEDHLAAFLDAYNFARRLKTLRGLTPYEAICKAWKDEPNRFIADPVHLTSGLNT